MDTYIFLIVVSIITYILLGVGVFAFVSEAMFEPLDELPILCIIIWPLIVIGRIIFEMWELAVWIRDKILELRKKETD